MAGNIIYRKSLFRGDDGGSDDQSNRTNLPLHSSGQQWLLFRQNAVHIGDLVAYCQEGYVGAANSQSKQGTADPLTGLHRKKAPTELARAGGKNSWVGQ